jgi:hypothetical protein
VSHLGTRLFADRFKDADVGLAAVVPLLASVLHGRDALPPPTVTVYDDTRDLRICSTIADLPERGVSYPCIRFLTVGVDYADTNPTQDASGAWMTSGTLQLGAQLLLRDDDNRNAATDGMYLLRAMRNVALFFNAAPTDERSACGITLLPTMNIRQGKIDTVLGDALVSPGSLLITAPFFESVPFSF